MKKLPKEKKNKLILIILASLIVTAGWGFGLLAWQRDHHKKALQQMSQRESTFITMTDAMAGSKKLEAELGEASVAIELLEGQMVSGDIYSWTVNTLREFRQNYQVDIPQVAQPTLAENKLIPDFPYRQASISLAGRATFHDLGMFVADFENRFSFARINNLEVKSSGMTGNAGYSTESEKLDFSMDIIFLVKPNTL